MFGTLFGKPKKDPKDMVKEWQRELRSEGRKLDRQIRDIERTEKKTILEAKKAAKQGNNDVVKILAKEVCQARKAVKRIHTSKAQMNSVSLSLNQQLAQLKVSGAMAKSADVMKCMNRLVNVTEVQQTMMSMQREMMQAGMIQEQVDDALDNALDDEDLDDDADAEVQKILDEEILNTLGAAGVGSSKLPQQQQAAVEAEEEDDDLAKRLQALKDA